MAANCRASASAATPLLGDMEDLIDSSSNILANPSLMSARDIKSITTCQQSSSSSSIQIKTGRKLYHRLRARRLDKLSMKDTNDTFVQQQQRQLRIVPVECLSNCDRGNCIAITAPGKYTYQFGDLDERRPEVLDDIIRFTMNYMESTDGFSKTKTRPTWMKSNVLARIPPLPIPSNLVPNWYNVEQEDTLEAKEIQRRLDEQKEKEQQEQMAASLLNNNNNKQQHDTIATSLVHRTTKHYHRHNYNHQQHSYTTSSSVNGLLKEREPCDCQQGFI
jgi:predicted metal-binding protein